MSYIPPLSLTETESDRGVEEEEETGEEEAEPRSKRQKVGKILADHSLHVKQVHIMS